MRRGRHRVRLVAMALTALLFGCTDDDPGPDTSDPDGDEQPGAGEVDSDVDPDPDADDVDEDAGATQDDEATPAGTIGFRGLQQGHPVGTLLGITAVTIDDHDNILVDLEAWHRGRNYVRLIRDGARLEDDLGNTYPVVEADDGRDLEVPSDYRADITLGFVGPIDPAARRVTLGFNSWDEFLTVDDEYRTFTPHFTFTDVALPGVGLDEEGVEADRGELDLGTTSVSVEGHGVTSDRLVATIEIHQVTVGPLSVEVEVFLRNDGSRPVLMASNRPRLLAERDGEPITDYPFEYIRVRTDRGHDDLLEVAPGEELVGTITFRGVVPRDADAVRVGFNTPEGPLERGESLEDSGFAPRPVFLGIDLPEREEG